MTDCLPWIADGTGKPLHSWRVLILPFLGEQALYERYDFSKAWDTPENRYVLEHMPPVFRCPEHVDAAPNATSYAAAFGPDCAFRGSQPVRFDEIADGLTHTIAIGLVESPSIPWTKPEDVDVTLHPLLHDADGFGGLPNGGTIVGFVGGSSSPKP